MRTMLFRLAIMAILLVTITGQSHAQEESRWSIYESFHGSTNSAGQVFKMDTGVAFDLNDHVGIGGGIPFYFVRGSSNSTTATGMQRGIGNAYVDLQFKATGPATFTSTITGTVPTGDKDKGFSTGRATVDWNNYIAMPLPRITPYANIGVANTISDTAFFVRPFSSLGVVGHFEGGATVSLAQYFSVGSSAYAIAPTGEQRIVSRVVQREVQQASGSSSSAASSNAQGRGATQSSQARSGQNRVFETVVETVGSADIAGDHGFSGWMEVAKGSDVYFQLGYSRSIPYQFDSVFFSLGFNVTSLLRKK